MIENGARHCLQWSPIVSEGAEAQTGAVRRGERALYYWIYPNFMINWYDGVMDTNLVVRFLTNDHPTMSRSAAALFEESASGKTDLLLETTIVAEAIFVLTW